MIVLGRQNDQLAHYLLKRGADPFIKNANGKSAADYVTPYSSVYEIIMKMKRERELNLMPPQLRLGKELHEEIGDISPQSSKIKEILERGANVNYQNENGYTALMLAADRQNDKIVEYLLKQGANPLLINKFGETARDLVSSSSPIFQLLQDAEMDTKTKLLTPKERYSQKLLNCIGGTDVNLIKIDECLESGADVNCRDSKGFTGLIIAVARGNEIIAEYLLKCGANPLIKNGKNKIASDYASSNSGIYALLKGFELLFHVMNSDLNAIKMILSVRPDLVNFKGNDGYTAMLIAAQNGDYNLVEYLLSQLADVSIKNNDGKDFFDLAANDEILSLVRAPGEVAIVEDAVSTDLDLPDEIEKDEPAEYPASNSHRFF